jgi:hypothetical protein
VAEFLAVALKPCDWVTLATMLVTGFGVGWFFLRSITSRAGLATWGVVVVGTAFFAFACTSRALQGVVNWPAWIGVWVLWLVFSAGAYLAMKPRRAA